MFEIGGELFNVSINDLRPGHDVMSLQGPFVTHMQHCVQRIEVSGGEQRSSCIKEMHAISSTPIRTKNARRESLLHHSQAAPRPSIYSVALSPNVSPVGKSHADLNNYSPSEKEFSNHMDAIVPSNSANGTESLVRIGINHHLARNIGGNELKRNVSRRLPMATAIQRTEQYVPLEIVSDEDAAESNAFTKKARSCRRPVNARRKPSVHFKTNSYRGLSTKYESIDSGRGGSAAISSETRTPLFNDKHSNNGSGAEDLESDSDSGLSHCTDGPSRSHCREDNGMERLHSLEREDGIRDQVSESPRFSRKGGKVRRVSRLPQPANNHQYDYEPLEIVSDDDNEDACSLPKRWTINQTKGPRKRIKAPYIVAGTAGRREQIEPDLDDATRNDGNLFVAAGHKSFGDRMLRQDENEDKGLSKTVAIIDSLLKVDEDDCEKENRKKKRRSLIHENQSYQADCSDADEPNIHLPRSNNIRHCSESFAQDEMNQGSFRIMGDASDSEASGYNGSAMEVDGEGEDEEYVCDLRENEPHKNRGNMANNSVEEFDESYEDPDELNAKSFNKQTSRIHQMQMSGFVDDDSRTRYEESFVSDYQCGNVEHDQNASGDNEDFDESGNVSGLLAKNKGHQLQQKRKQIRTMPGKKRRFMENSRNEDTFSDHESPGDMNADISGYTEFDHRRNIQELIQSRNDSYCQQDSFNSQSLLRRKATRYLSPRGSNLNKRNGIMKEIDSKQRKGTMKKSVKKVVPSKASSVGAGEKRLSFSRKQGRHASLKLGKSPTGSSSEEKDAISSSRQPKKIVGGSKLSSGKKLSRKSLDKTNVANAPSGKKGAKGRAKSNSDAKSSETAESDGPPAKIKRGRAKLNKANKTHEQLKGNTESQGESSENTESGSSSEMRVRKSSQMEPSETTEFETPPLKGKRGKTKATKSKEATGQQDKGSQKSQSESSETAESGSSPQKKKRGRPPLKSKKSADVQSKVLSRTKICESQSEPLECGESSTLPKGKKRGRPAKTGKASQAQEKGSASSEQNQSKVGLPESENGPSSLKKQKVKAPRKNVKKQKVDTDAESLPKNNDGLHVSSSDSESDKSGLHKRRPLFSSEKFTNELLLSQNEVLPEATEKKTEAQPKLPPLRDKKRPAESSSDYLRKKVLTMRLGTSAFHNSVLEENELVVTSTPKKSSTDSRTSSTSRVESVSDEVFEEQEANSSKVLGPLHSTPVKRDGDLEKKDKLNKSKGVSEANEPVLLPVHSCDDVLNKKIEPIDEPVPDAKSQGSCTKTEGPEKKVPECLPHQGMVVNDRLLSLPLMNSSAAGLLASTTGSTSRGSVPVLVDGCSMDLELYADYSKIPFRSRQKESKGNGVQYGAALDVLGLGTGYIHLTPGTEKGLQHPKSYNMVFLILNGQVKVQIHESEILAKPGDFFAVPKGCKYNLTGTGDRNAIVAYFKSKAS